MSGLEAIAGTAGGMTLSEASGILWDHGARFKQGQRANERHVRKTAQWAMRGDFYLRGRTVPRDQSIQPPRDLNRRAAQWIEQVAPAHASALNRHLSPVAVAAFRDWPIDTGMSKSLLSLDYVVAGDGSGYRAQITNRAPYANYIRSPGRKAARKAVFDAVAGRQGGADKIAAFFEVRKEQTDRRRAQGHSVTQLVFRPGEAAADRIQADVANEASKP